MKTGSRYPSLVDRIHPPVASAVVEIPEYDPDHVYAWKPANNYKGWKLIDRGEAGVDDASVTQSAINSVYNSNGGAVYLKGVFTITQRITVKKGVWLCGNGRYIYEEDKIYGSGLYGSITDYILELEKETYLIGLAIVNNTQDAILVSDTMVNIQFCDIFAKRYGIHLNPPQSTVEAKIYRNRLTGDGTNSIGIYIENMSDTEIHYNIIRGFETGIQINAGCGNTNITRNHIYKYPATAIKRGILNKATFVEIHGNYIEGKPTIAGIETLERWSIRIYNNRIIVSQGAFGIYYNLPSAGALVWNYITGNLISGESDEAKGDTAIKGVNVINLVDCEIHSNQIRYFTNEGIKSKNKGTATFSGDGSTTQFKIEHGLIKAPSKILITPMTADAAGDFYVTADDTYIYINYKTAPPSGTDNIKVSWYAEV